MIPSKPVKLLENRVYLYQGVVPMRGYINRQKGISLVEVIVAMALTAIVSLAILAAVSQSAVFGGKADKIYTASIVAQKRIDLLKKFSFSDLAGMAPETDTAVDVDEDGTTDYMRTTTVTEDYEGYTGLIKVKVIVERIEDGVKKGGPVVMETLMSDVTGA